MANSYVAQVDNPAIAEELRKRKIPKVHIADLRRDDLPDDKPFLMVLEYSDTLSVFFDALNRKKWDIPVFITDGTFNPAHSREAWCYPQVVGYLVWNAKESEKTLQEIVTFVQEIVSRRERASETKSRRKVGAFVQIAEKNYRDHNLVSLFVGKMRDFMVELKLLCDSARPSKLQENYIREFPDIMKLLEFEKARRLKEDKFPYQDKYISIDEYARNINVKRAEQFFKTAPATKSRATILIRGESGTGKSIIADFIHQYVYQGRANAGNLQIVTCTNIGENLFESQLFGCLRGAFTDAVPQPGAIVQAYNGTLFLDEIGDLTPYHQARLLQYLEDGMVSPMNWVNEPIYVPTLVVAATNQDLEEKVREKSFREDLYHRLGVYVTIPPLKERIGEIDRLVDFVLQNPLINPRKAVKMVDERVFEYLRAQEFPGNFRELEHLLRWAVVQARKDGVDVLTIDHVKYPRESRPAAIVGERKHGTS